jgi:hypothetical protein
VSTRNGCLIAPCSQHRSADFPKVLRVGSAWADKESRLSLTGRACTYISREVQPIITVICCKTGLFMCGLFTVIQHSTNRNSFPMSTLSLFKWRHFLPEIILLNVRWYSRYPLSYRDLEEMMLERGLPVDHSTVYRWVQAYCPKTGQTSQSLSETN